MDRKRTFGCLALLASLLAGCAGIKVDADYDPKADFTALRSYAWLPAPRDRSGDPRIDNPLLAARVEQAVDRALTTKGFAKVEAAQADFFVTFHIGIDQKLDVTTIPTTFGYYGRRGALYAGTETRVDQYEEGTLLIDFVDRERDDLLWRGSGQSRISQSKSPQEREARIQKAVDAILAQFPPAAAK